jgi:hypothetical protein
MNWTLKSDYLQELVNIFTDLVKLFEPSKISGLFYAYRLLFISPLITRCVKLSIHHESKTKLEGLALSLVILIFVVPLLSFGGREGHEDDPGDEEKKSGHHENFGPSFRCCLEFF